MSITHAQLPDTGQRTHYEIDAQLPDPNQKDALAGTGTPSATHPYVTQPPAALVYNSAAITIPDDTPTYLTFDSETSDVDDCHSTTTNTGRLTAPVGEGGLYLVTACVEWAANSSGERSLAIVVNRSSVICMAQLTPAAIALQHHIATVCTLSAGDYVEVRAWQDRGGNLDIQRTADYSPTFALARIA